MDINDERLHSVVGEIVDEGGICKGVVADVTEEDQVIRFFVTRSVSGAGSTC
ncbi:MAG: hypothetical protein R2844_10970 [Caldilineales bacterium]